jgi:hypothetical protein
MDNAEDKETIYEIAIRELIKETGMEGSIYLVYDQSLTNYFWTRQIEGRKIIFISNENEKEEQKKNGNILRMYELEYPKISNDRIEIKINHQLAYEIDLKKGESEWPRSMTEIEKEITRQGIEKSNRFYGDQNLSTYSAIIHITCSYVTFKFNSSDNEFLFEKIETITKH